jgi:hypothetical protein
VLCIAAGLLRQRAISRCQRWQKGSRVSRETTIVIDKH